MPGERVAVNLSHLGYASTCIGMVTFISPEAEDRAVVFVGGGTLEIQLLEPQRKNAHEPLQPGQWCSIESLHFSGIF